MYIVFGGESYYARGGGNDYLDDSISLEDATEIANDAVGKKAMYREPEWDGDEGDFITIEWAQVFDSVNRKIVFEAGRCYGSGDNQLKVIK